jgi:hypothetical protein
MSKHRNVELARLQAMNVPRIRPHEGSSVTAVVGQSAMVNGVMVHSAAINLADAPVPERKYAANACGVVYEPGNVQLLFAQRRIGGDELRSLLVIQMSPAGAVRLLAAAAQLSPHSLDDLVQQGIVQVERSRPITVEPAQTVEMAAGFCLFAAGPDMATLDFYQASAFALSAVPHAKKLAVDPVVRIDIRTSLLIGLVEQLRELGPKLPQMTTESPK